MKETDLGVAQAFFLPLKETMLEHTQYIFFYIFFACNPNEILLLLFIYSFILFIYDGVLPRTP